MPQDLPLGSTWVSSNNFSLQCGDRFRCRGAVVVRAFAHDTFANIFLVLPVYGYVIVHLVREAKKVGNREDWLPPFSYPALEIVNHVAAATTSS